jgi:hypothetical protein
VSGGKGGGVCVCHSLVRKTAEHMVLGHYNPPAVSLMGQQMLP